MVSTCCRVEIARYESLKGEEEREVGELKKRLLDQVENVGSGCTRSGVGREVRRDECS